MMRLGRSLLAAVMVLMSAAAALGQGAVVQGGAVKPGRAPMYTQGGTGATTIVQDSGPASGGATAGVGFSEMLLVARGVGTAPYVAQGSGPNGTNWCDYDAPISNATGYHYLCFGVNPGQFVYGAGSTASAIPFSFLINGLTYNFPAAGGTFVTAPVANSSLATVPAATFKGNPTASAGVTPTDFTVQGLPARGAPDANNDRMVLYNAATGAFNYVTPGQIATAATAGVTSFGGQTGAITLGTGLSMAGNVLNNTIPATPPGGSSGQIQYNNAGAFAGFTASGDVSITPSTGATLIQPAAVGNTKLVTGAANTVKGTVNGTSTSDLAVASCSALYNFTQWVTGTGWQCGINPVIPSRAIAATLNLSAFTSVTTQGYATPGDGGGATFLKTSSGFIDSYMNGFSFTAGSGYTNGTYLGIPFGFGCNGSAVVSGGVVTSVSITTVCPQVTTSTVFSPNNSFLGGSGTGFTVHVTSVATAQGSFTDSASNKFQYVTDQAGMANILQFGAKGDWNGTDGSATNNSPAIWSATSWASYPVGSAAATVFGNKIIFPRGAYMTCGAFNGTIFDIPISQGIIFDGLNIGSTGLRECAADSNANHYIELCDAQAAVGQSSCTVINMTVDTSAVTGSTSGIATIYSNSGQQFPLGVNLFINSGNRSCIKYELGKGGAANDIWYNIQCTQFPTSTNPGWLLNSASTQHIIRDSVYACGTSGCPAAIVNNAGRLILDGFDTEGASFTLVQNVSTNGNLSVARNIQQNSTGCTATIQLSSSNVAGNILMENVAQSCPITIQNGQSGGSNWTSNIRGPLMCVSGACAAAVP